VNGTYLFPLLVLCLGILAIGAHLRRPEFMHKEAQESPASEDVHEANSLRADVALVALSKSAPVADGQDCLFDVLPFESPVLDEGSDHAVLGPHLENRPRESLYPEPLRLVERTHLSLRVS
jgi:hypothetical protein